MQTWTPHKFSLCATNIWTQSPSEIPHLTESIVSPLCEVMQAISPLMKFSACVTGTLRRRCFRDTASKHKSLCLKVCFTQITESIFCHLPLAVSSHADSFGSFLPAAQISASTPILWRRTVFCLWCSQLWFITFKPSNRWPSWLHSGLLYYWNVSSERPLLHVIPISCMQHLI